MLVKGRCIMLVHLDCVQGALCLLKGRCIMLVHLDFSNFKFNLNVPPFY